MSETKRRIPLQTVVLFRDGQRIVPPIGRPYAFTLKEIADIKKLNPDALGEIVNQDEPTGATGKMISADDHEAALAKARADAVAQFKLQQGIKDVPETAGAADVVKPGDGEKAPAGAKSDKKGAKNNAADDDI